MNLSGRKILVVDCYDSFTWNLLQLLEECGATGFDVIKCDQINSEAVAAYDKILLSPGPGLSSEIVILKEIIQKYSADKSILGICLGHQAIVEAFGGKLVNMPVPMHGQKTLINLTDKNHYLFKNIPERIEAGLYHSWMVAKEFLPGCLDIIAESDDGMIMAVAHEHYDVCGLQFHPESILTPHGKTMIENWVRK